MRRSATGTYAPSETGAPGLQGRATDYAGLVDHRMGGGDGGGPRSRGADRRRGAARGPLSGPGGPGQDPRARRAGRGPRRRARVVVLRGGRGRAGIAGGGRRGARGGGWAAAAPAGVLPPPSAGGPTRARFWT